MFEMRRGERAELCRSSLQAATQLAYVPARQEANHLKHRNLTLRGMVHACSMRRP